jgi:hypothetical protein
MADQLIDVPLGPEWKWPIVWKSLGERALDRSRICRTPESRTPESRAPDASTPSRAFFPSIGRTHAFSRTIAAMAKASFQISNLVTLFIKVPMGSIVIRISSPASSVKSSGGTMPVPVSRKQP